ncbi:Bgt-2889-2 [Blumeria graminis f. sp. tritici]|uniref:Bgt-2889-2 n=2 Tax=Blumeria graminis f. sp. tritici TaxID=62690 RepID=A0A061HJE8_BLUGR|nr:hypothetical protein BGT96224_2889B [Blumeria graminis f. sp. tritici 96224]VDB94874.1 Bgt-2889-2 [Blumeria graminis f. sp. tritici]
MAVDVTSSAKPLQTPIGKPSDTSQIPPAVELTAPQKVKYEDLLKIVKSWKEIPSRSGKNGPVTESEIFWLTKECLLRYLRASKWDTAKSAKRIQGTLTWRRDFGVEEITGDGISSENETGKLILLGYDLFTRPCGYMYAGRQNSEAGPRQVQFVVFMLERMIDFTEAGQDTLTLIINLRTKATAIPSLGQAKEILDIIQTHYPERLGKAFLSSSWMVDGFFRLLTPFIDPQTREKLVFNGDAKEIVPVEQLCKDFQGGLEFEYDHKIYWPALLKLCAEKRDFKWKRWVEAGKNYGESEFYLKGGNELSVSHQEIDKNV